MINEKQEVKVNIIVPLYNMERYISQTLESLINQSFQDIEILCINDGSTDRSLEIIDSYSKKDKRIKVYTKKNGGIADARNYGLTKVTAPYFAFVDSDDTVEPDFILTMYNEAIKSKSDVVTCDFWWSYEDGEKLQKDGPYLTKQELLTTMFATLWNKLYKTEWVKSLDIQFPTGYRYEDASFLYKMIPYLNTWSYVDKPFIHYVQRPGSITHNHNDKVKNMIYVFEDLLDYYKKNGLFDTYKTELEYLFIRFFLGNSFLRTCQIKDREDRHKTLELSYQILNQNFPSWKKNSYLKGPGLKNKVFSQMNRTLYFGLAWMLNKVYAFKSNV